MKSWFVNWLFDAVRYFCAHGKVVFVVSGKRETKKEMQKIINEFRILEKEKLLIVKFGGGAVDKIKTIVSMARAKIVCLETGRLETILIDFGEKNCDAMTYEFIDGELRFNRIGKEFNFKYTDKIEYYHCLVKFLYNFSRIDYKRGWFSRFTDAVLNGTFFSFLYPTILLVAIKAILKQFDKAFNFIYRNIIDIIIIIIGNFCKDDRLIVIRSCHHQFNCNPKYIYNEIARNSYFNDWKIVWLLDYSKNVNINEFPSRIKLIKNKSFFGKLYLVMARVIVDNSVLRDIRYVRKRQLLIQTWHGSLGIKKFNFAWSNAIGENNDNKTKLCISNSEFEDFVFRDSYWKKTKIERLGHARNDILFEKNKKIINKIRKKIGIPDDVHVVMYAPTFRDAYRGKAFNLKMTDLVAYNINRQMVIDSLRKRFGGKWVWLDRFHFHLRKFRHFSDTYKSKNIRNVSDYPDVQELLLVSDIVISDYSSLMFDYMLRRKPVFVYANDIESYNSERSFFYPLEETPFPITTSNADLCDAVEKFDNNKYIKRVNQFLLNKKCIDDGGSSKRIVSYLIKELEK